MGEFVHRDSPKAFAMREWCFTGPAGFGLNVPV
jgi:hypothetical protein